MAVKEESFRIGCGRYLQKPDAVLSLGEEVKRLGTSPLVVGGKTALGITREKIENSLQNICQHFVIKEYSGTCNEEQAIMLANKAREEGLDVIVGVGGGVIMDFAKLIGFFARLPIINIPTSSATCAAYTPLSVCYTKEGRTIGTRHFPNEVNTVLVDTAILISQPIRLLLSGIFDAIAKFVEIKHRFSEGDLNYPLGLDWAYVMAQHSFKQLNELTEECITDMLEGKISDTVERVIFTSIAVTGVISGIARGSNQTALAHKFYENSRVLFFEECRGYLHGEIVGVGLLLQNIFNNEEGNNVTLLKLMRKYGMPCSARDVGIESSEKAFDEYYSRICNSSSINKDDLEQCRKLKESLQRFWKI